LRRAGSFAGRAQRPCGSRARVALPQDPLEIPLHEPCFDVAWIARKARSIKPAATSNFFSLAASGLAEQRIGEIRLLASACSKSCERPCRAARDRRQSAQSQELGLHPGVGAGRWLDLVVSLLELLHADQRPGEGTAMRNGS
jgi:hypothetical protein